MFCATLNTTRAIRPAQAAGRSPQGSTEDGVVPASGNRSVEMVRRSDETARREYTGDTKACAYICYLRREPWTAKCIAD